MERCEDAQQAALIERVSVESLWVPDAISERFARLETQAEAACKAAANVDSTDTFTRIEAANQEKGVCASVKAWCQGHSCLKKARLGRISTCTCNCNLHGLYGVMSRRCNRKCTTTSWTESVDTLLLHLGSELFMITP